MTTKSIYTVATLEKPLGRDDQVSLWYDVQSAIVLLTEYTKTMQLQIQVHDKAFRYYNKELVTAYLKDPKVNKRDKGIVRLGQKSCNRLVTSNMRMIIKVASQYESTKVSRDELVQAGVQGMVKAVLKFTPTSESKNKNKQLSLLTGDKDEDVIRYYKVSSYGFFWIKHAISSYVKDLDPFKINSDNQKYYTVPLDTADSRGQEYYSEPDAFVGNVRLSTEELQILDSTSLELAIDRNIPIGVAEDIKKNLYDQVRVYYESLI